MSTASRPMHGVRLLAVLAAFTVGLVLGAGPAAAQADSRPDAAAGTEDTAIRPFHVQVRDEDLSNLRQRVRATRWPDKETVPDQSQGVPLARLQELVRYWGTDCDWRKVEGRLNALPQFITRIDGLDIHFIHVRSRHSNAM